MKSLIPNERWARSNNIEFCLQTNVYVNMYIKNKHHRLSVEHPIYWMNKRASGGILLCESKHYWQHQNDWSLIFVDRCCSLQSFLQEKWLWLIVVLTPQFNTKQSTLRRPWQVCLSSYRECAQSAHLSCRVWFRKKRGALGPRTQRILRPNLLSRECINEPQTIRWSHHRLA